MIKQTDNIFILKGLKNNKTLPLDNEQTTIIQNSKLVKISVSKAIGDKYAYFKGFHWKIIRTDRQPNYLERIKKL